MEDFFVFYVVVAGIVAIISLVSYFKTPEICLFVPKWTAVLLGVWSGLFWPIVVGNFLYYKLIGKNNV